MTRQERIASLISQMTLEEKVSQLLHDSLSVDRLNIPAYNWWNECLHGVARAGFATVFPQAIGMAATFDDEFIQKVAEAISDEARAKYNEAVKIGVRRQYRGLTYWTPNINIFRDPRWGRGQETYGEDPHLTASMGKAFVRGLQGNDPENLKLAACAKHYAVHSGPEKDRHTFDAVVSNKDLFETYLPAFKALVEEGVESVMGAYNRTLGEPCCGSKYLLKDILRGKWKFKGHVVSDCWAVRDFHEHHKVTSSPEESAALALNNGCDLNCGCTYHAAVQAVRTGLVSEKTVDESLTRLLTTRFKLGMFDDPNASPWAKLDNTIVNCPGHRSLALETARKSIVLLKNDNNILPLSSDPKKLLLIGPSAADIHTLTANYHGLSPRLVTILEGLTAKTAPMTGISIDYSQGCMMYSENKNTGWTIGMAESADVVIACFGLDNAIEGEEGDAIASEAKGDRTAIELPVWQYAYLRALRSRGTPVVLILTGGAPIAVPDDIADAVLFAWYPGEEGGTAVADILFGDTVPSGKLPITFPKSTAQLPPYDDYNMKGRTYRYMKEEPQYPFGFGLSYTTFAFPNIKTDKTSFSAKTGSPVTVTAEVQNTGTRSADEVVQIYVSKENPAADDPVCSLRAFKRVHIKAGETAKVSFDLSAAAFETVLDDGTSTVLPGTYYITAADSAPLLCAERRGAAKPSRIKITVTE